MKITRGYLLWSKRLAYLYVGIQVLGVISALFGGLELESETDSNWYKVQPKLPAKEIPWLNQSQEMESMNLEWLLSVPFAILFVVLMQRFQNVLCWVLGIDSLSLYTRLAAVANVLMTVVFSFIMTTVPMHAISLPVLYLTIWAPSALVFLLFGIRLITCPNRLLGVRDFYAFSMIAFGISVLVVYLLPLAIAFWLMGSLALAIFFSRAVEESS